MGFGHRVIGREAAEKEAKEIATGRRSFGHRVVGGDGPKPQAPARVRGNAPAAPGEAVHERGKSPIGEKIEPVKAVDSFSVDQLESLLGENSSLFDDLFGLELSRADGARAEALRVFQRYELAGQDRPDVIHDIQELLAARAAGVPVDGDPVPAGTPPTGDSQGEVAPPDDTPAGKARAARAKKAASKK